MLLPAICSGEKKENEIEKLLLSAIESKLLLGKMTATDVARKINIDPSKHVTNKISSTLRGFGIQSRRTGQGKFFIFN